MLPTVWPGDLLTIQSHRPDQAEPGEIVLYMRRGRFFIHRVVSKSLDRERNISDYPGRLPGGKRSAGSRP